MTPSAAFPFESKFVEVLGSTMHYVESGSGDPILFVHGNPTSSYLWRNVIPYAAVHGRAIAVDLIGMGKSAKPDIDYRFFDHLRYLEGFIDALELRNITLVLHDWGGGLGLTYARRHPDNVAAVAFMEAVVKPIDRSEMDLPVRFVFDRMRDPKKGDRMNLDKNFFLKRLMPMMTGRKLTPVERAAYLEPYPTPASRKPVAVWPREVPISGQPADVDREIAMNFEWLRTAPLPKLFLYAKPGAILKKKQVAELQASVPDLESVFVGKGKHYIQETAPDAIGLALSSWLVRTHSAPT